MEKFDYLFLGFCLLLLFVFAVFCIDSASDESIKKECYKAAQVNYNIKCLE